MGFLDQDFLLSTDAARRLYHDHAAPQPVLDYHCHLSAKDIADDRRFNDLYEIWLEGDHYKWRAMRTHGVHESFCTGKAKPYEKFLAWAKTLPFTLRNPLYHWSHLELQRYFGISELLNENTAESIWQRANAELPKLTARAILSKFQVKVLCTTDDPTDDLFAHKRIAASNCPTQVFPTFRPDRALDILRPRDFLLWLDRLSAISNIEITSLGGFIQALAQRHDAFHEAGCRSSDHGLDRCYALDVKESTAEVIFHKALKCALITPEEHEQFASYLMRFFGRLDAQKGWVMQLHLGAARNINTQARESLGPDTGFDAIGDRSQGRPLAGFLDLLAVEDSLPKIVLYNSNPAETYVFATIAGSFQSGSIPGKVQYGAPWWFLDQRQGMLAQLEALSNTGVLGHFVGMVTDSRSFMSFPRHEYFRRVLCELLGSDMARGELPENVGLFGPTVEAICYSNAAHFFDFPARAEK